MPMIEISHANLNGLLDLTNNDPNIKVLCHTIGDSVTNFLHSVEVTIKGEKATLYHGDFLGLTDEGKAIYYSRWGSPLLEQRDNLLDACQAQEEAEEHHSNCEECDDNHLCDTGADLYRRAKLLRQAAIAKAEGK